MSDRDPLEQLARFGTGGPVTPLPPAEVRRRGDRRRARRTAVSAVAGVVAVLAVALPAGLYAARDGGHPAPPSTTASETPTSPMVDPTPLGGWRRTIPDDFRIAIGLDALDGPARQMHTGEDVGVADVELCGVPWWERDDGTTRVGAFALDAESSAVQRRTVALFPASTDAQALLAKARRALEDCPLDRISSEDYASSNEIQPRVLSGAGDESLVFIGRGGPADGDQVLYDTGLGVYAMVRVGNALAVVEDTGEGGGSASTIASSLRQVEAATLPLVREMCIFAVDPCSGPSTAATDIPSDFPLDRASDHTKHARTIGPDRRTGVPYPLPCGATGIETERAVDRLGFQLLGDNVDDLRELATFADEDTARRAMEAIRTSVEACPTETSGAGRTRTWAPIPEDTGYASYSFSETLQPMGGAVYQYTRVGRAILTVVWASDGTTPKGAARDIGQVTRISTAIARAMCEWSDGGCRVDAGLVFGPDGVGGLRLGMSAAQVRASGAATAVQGSAHDGWKEGCLAVDYTFTDDEQPGDLNGRVSPSQGLEQLVATSAMRTPGGIHLGSTRAEVEAGFAHLVGNGDVLTSPAGDGSWHYAIYLGDGKVTRLTLELPRQDCEI